MCTVVQRTWIVLMTLLMMAGCGSHQLKTAQDSYNEAALLEAQLSFEEIESKGDPLAGTPQALRNYRVALSLTDTALEKHAKGLKQDELYGTALMLKALCQWRIAALDGEADPDKIKDIIDDIETRVGQENVTLGTRDRVLLKALPGLREHALGLQQSDPNRARRFFESALNTLDQSLSDVNPPQDHPVRTYIRLAQMRTLRAWRWVEYPHKPTDLPELIEWNRRWNQRYEAYRRRLAPLMEANVGLKARIEAMDKDFGYQ